MGGALGLAAWHVRSTARLLIVALSVTTLGPMLHGAHDPDLAPVIIAHDAARHHAQASSARDSAVEGDHCVACHFVRSSRGPVSWEPSGLIAFASGNLLYHSDGELAAAPSATPLPARAPPLS
jgi:hypothetical protein